MSQQHLQLTSASLCSLFHKWYGVKNCKIYFCRWIEMNDNEFWAEFSDSVVQMLCKFSKRKLQSTDNQLTAILLCCLGRIRTLTGGTRIRRATITPQGNFFNQPNSNWHLYVFWPLVLTTAKLQLNLISPKYFHKIYRKKCNWIHPRKPETPSALIYYSLRTALNNPSRKTLPSPTAATTPPLFSPRKQRRTHPASLLFTFGFA